MWSGTNPRVRSRSGRRTRFAEGGPRGRKIGIVAVARRLLIDLWRYVTHGVLPDGAIVIAPRAEVTAHG